MLLVTVLTLWHEARAKRPTGSISRPQAEWSVAPRALHAAICKSQVGVKGLNPEPASHSHKPAYPCRFPLTNT